MAVAAAAVKARPAPTDANEHFSPAALALLIGGGLVLYIVLAGKSDKVLAALQGTAPQQGWSIGSGSTSKSSAASSGVGISTKSPGKVGSNGFPDPSLFGIGGKVQSFFDYIVQGSDPNIKAADTSGLKYAGGGNAVHDWDYGIPWGTAVQLPGDSSTVYTVARSYFQAGVGWITAFRAPNGGIFEYVHLSDNGGVQPGQQLTGGTNVGKSGAPLSSEWGSGAHLAVIADAGGAAWLTGQGQ